MGFRLCLHATGIGFALRLLSASHAGIGFTSVVSFQGYRGETGCYGLLRGDSSHEDTSAGIGIGFASVVSIGAFRVQALPSRLHLHPGCGFMLCLGVTG